VDHVREFAQLDRQEDEPEQSRDDEPCFGPQHVLSLRGDDREAADEAREQQRDGLDGDERAVEQLGWPGARVRRANERCERTKSQKP
jgi:hypothetical protein